jgi:hypothetical protein
MVMCLYSFTWESHPVQKNLPLSPSSLDVLENMLPVLELEIPAQYQHSLLPEVRTSVSIFVSQKLPSPRKASALKLIDILSCYRAEEPTEDPSCLLERLIPSCDVVRKIKEEFEQAVQGGCRSIIDPHCRAGALPLWTVQYWTEMHKALEAQETWKRALKWVGEVTEPTCVELQKQTQSHFAFLGWNERMNLPGTTTSSLAALLAGDMVSTSVVDTIVSKLQRRAESNGRFIIADLCFQHEIEKAKNIRDFNKPSRGLLQKLEVRLVGSPRSLFFPIHVSEQLHFVAVRVDFEKQAVSYGNYVFLKQ